jgi:tetratricopeptide (TPR) repeat protein
MNATIQSALAAHQRGDLIAAEQGYRSVLAAEAGNVDAMHLLGLIAKQNGRVDEAISHIRRAVELAPASAILHYNLGDALAAAGRIGDAADSYRTSVRLQPELAEAWQNLSAILEQSGELAGSLESCQRACELRPHLPELRCNLANVLSKSERFDEALETLQSAIQQSPSHAPAYCQLGLLHWRLGQFDRARQSFEQGLAMNQSDVALWINFGRLSHLQERYEDAAAAYQAALHIAPHSYETLVNWATLCKDLGEYEQAITLFERAIALAPARLEAWHNLGKTYEEQGDLRLAIANYGRAVVIDPRHGEVRLNRALALLQAGDFATGWREYEWRWYTNDAPTRPQLQVPTWDGAPLDDHSMLVWGEQGVGDEIMFASCYPDVIAQAHRVAMVCDDRLAPLLQRSFPQACVIGAKRGQEQWDRLTPHWITCQIAAGSLPLHLRQQEREFGDRGPYLVPDQSAVQRWRERFAALGPGLKVGISWIAGTTPKHRRHRTTSLADWLPLLQLPQVDWVDLQYGDTSLERDQLPGDVRLHHFTESDPLRDLDDFAAQIAALNLVISVGNATVHLAGALGAPCWAMLPAHWGWRWLTDRTDTLWYSSVRLWRQQVAGDWHTLFAQVAEQLLKTAHSAG